MKATTRGRTVREFRYADRVRNLPFEQSRSLDAGAISFGAGDGYSDAFPDLSVPAHQAVNVFRAETLQYSPRAGLPELRQWVAEYVRRDGTRITADNVLIVNGAKHGLDLVCRVFLNPHDTVVVTRPTYQSALQIFRTHEVQFLEVGQDDDGLLVAELDERLMDLKRRHRDMPKLIYDVPEFHNPTGIVMSAQHRMALVDLARRYEIMIVEDDPYRRIRFEGASVPSIRSFDEDGHYVIGLGTFAKTIAPGLRVGWITAPDGMIQKFAAFKSDGGSCPLTQRIALEYYKGGMFERHIEQVRRIYGEHRDAMLQAIAKHIPQASTRVPQGGYYLWLRLPESVDTAVLADIALNRGVEFFPGRRFFASPGGSNYLRLAHSFASLPDIATGIARLAGAIAEAAGASIIKASR